MKSTSGKEFTPVLQEKLLTALEEKGYKLPKYRAPVFNNLHESLRYDRWRSGQMRGAERRRFEREYFA